MPHSALGTGFSLWKVKSKENTKKGKGPVKMDGTHWKEKGS